MRIPPADAYLKIRHTIEEVNGILSSATVSLTEEERQKY